VTSSSIKGGEAQSDTCEHLQASGASCCEEAQALPDITVAEKDIVRFFSEMTPAMLAVMTPERRIIYANTRLLNFMGAAQLDEVRGKCFGTASHCSFASLDPRGCGYSPHCSTCAIFRAIRETEKGEVLVRELTLKGGDGSTPVFRARLHEVTINDQKVIAILMHDISDEKRRETLERLFYHDFLNAAAGILGILEVLEDDEITDDANTHMLRTAKLCAHYLVDEIAFSRALSSAENEKLQLKAEPILIAELFEKVSGFFLLMLTHAEVNLEIGDIPRTLCIVTDRTLVTRILINLVKNAIEASKAGQRVSLRATKEDGHMHCEVHNQGCMSYEVQEKVFVRAFTTKGKGRGIGTYSVKMFTEQYLHGKVWFTSSQAEGTTFHVLIPSLASGDEPVLEDINSASGKLRS
jgi:signal transduction histidine kinase